MHPPPPSCTSSLTKRNRTNYWMAFGLCPASPETNYLQIGRRPINITRPTLKRLLPRIATKRLTSWAPSGHCRAHATHLINAQPLQKQNKDRATGWLLVFAPQAPCELPEDGRRTANWQVFGVSPNNEHINPSRRYRPTIAGVSGLVPAA